MPSSVFSPNGRSSSCPPTSRHAAVLMSIAPARKFAVTPPNSGPSGIGPIGSLDHASTRSSAPVTTSTSVLAPASRPDSPPGTSSSSLSSGNSHSPRASLAARLRAAVTPRAGWRIRRTRRSSIAVTPAAVPSVDPSSTTITSRGTPSSSRQLLIAATTTSTRLRTGMMTLTMGSPNPRPTSGVSVIRKRVEWASSSVKLVEGSTRACGRAGATIAPCERLVLVASSAARPARSRSTSRVAADGTTRGGRCCVSSPGTRHGRAESRPSMTRAARRARFASPSTATPNGLTGS